MEEAAVVREEKGSVSVLTMQYRPYNLLGPTLLGAIQERRQPVAVLGVSPAPILWDICGCERKVRVFAAAPTRRCLRVLPKTRITPSNRHERRVHHVQVRR